MEAHWRQAIPARNHGSLPEVGAGLAHAANFQAAESNADNLPKVFSSKPDDLGGKIGVGYLDADCQDLNARLAIWAIMAVELQ